MAFNFVSGNIEGPAQSLGAIISVQTATGAKLTTTAASDGSFSIELSRLPGQFPITVMVALFGFTFFPMSITLNTSGTAIFASQAIPADVGVLSGNAGIAGATINYSGPTSGSVTAGGDGAFGINGLQNGTYTLTPSLPGYSFAPSSRVATINNDGIGNLNFTAFASYAVSGSAGLAFGLVSVTPLGVVGEHSVITVQADSHGNFTIPNLMPGTYSISVYSKTIPTFYNVSPASQSVTVTNKAVTGVNFTSVPPTGPVYSPGPGPYIPQGG